MSLLERRHPDFGGLDLQKETIGEHALIARNIELDTPGQISKRGGLGRVNQHRYNGGISLIADVQRICDYGRVLVVGSLPVPGQPVPFPPSSGDVWEDQGGGVGSGPAPSGEPYYEDPVFPPVILNAWATPGSVHFFVLAYDPQGLPLSYEWDFGGGDISNEQNPTRPFPTGVFSAVVTVTNSSGKSSSIAVANIGPTADLQMSPLFGVPPPLTVNFDASGSDGDGAVFDLDFGDGTPHSTNPVGTHDYTTGGIFNAVLTVTDKFGATDTDTKQVVTDPWVLEQNINTTLGVTNIIDWCEHGGKVYCVAEVGASYKIIYRDAVNDWKVLANAPANPLLVPTSIVSFGGDLFVVSYFADLRVYRWNGAAFVADGVFPAWAEAGKFVVLDGKLLLIAYGPGGDVYCSERTGVATWSSALLAGVGIGTKAYIAYRSNTFNRGWMSTGGVITRTGLNTVTVSVLGNPKPGGNNSAEFGGNVYVGAGASGNLLYKNGAAGVWSAIALAAAYTRVDQVIEGDSFLILYTTKSGVRTLVRFETPGTFSDEKSGWTLWTTGLACDSDNIYAFRNNGQVYRRVR